MKTSFSNKLTDTLQQFNKYELNRFGKYVCSPFFNENKQLVDLLELLSQQLKKHNEILLDKEVQWDIILPNIKFNDTKFRRLHSDLLKLLEGFIAYQTQHSYPIYPQLNLLQGINEMGLEKLGNTSLKQAETIQKKHTYRDADYYLTQYQLLTEKEKLIRGELQRDQHTNLGDKVDNLDYFYLIEKLNLYCQLLDYKQAFQIDYEPLFATEIIEHLRKVDYDHIPAIPVFFQVFLTLTEPEEETHFTKLKDLLNQHITKFKATDARMLYSFAQNYCIIKINRGQGQYMNELFGIYKTALEKEIIFEKGELSVWDYKNIVTVGARIKEYEWVESFINDYKDKLPLTYRDNAYSFNLARLYFSKKDYDNVISLLATVEYQDVFYMLDSKTMLLKTYYETNEDEPLYALLDSFKMLLSRKKIVAPAYRTNYGNLLKHTRRLIDHRNGKKVDLQKLLKKLDTDSNVADIGWIKEKINDLIN